MSPFFDSLPADAAVPHVFAMRPDVYGPFNAGNQALMRGDSPLTVAGEHVDVWGCVWSNIKTGRESIVTGHPVPTREAVRTLQPPQEDAGFRPRSGGRPRGPS